MKAKRKEKVEKRKRFSIEREKAVKIQENAIFSQVFNAIPYLFKSFPYIT